MVPRKPIYKNPPKKRDFNANVVTSSGGRRILCIADTRGALCQINTLVKKYRADAVIHTGNFGFFDGDSADSMPKEVLASAANSSPVVNGTRFQDMDEEHLRESVGSQLSELPLFLAGAQRFIVPVYTIWGGNEDISVIEKFRDGTYKVSKLNLIDEYSSPLIPKTSIRLMGLPGMFLKSMLFNIADGQTVPGKAGSTWTGIWQIGEMLHTFAKTYNPNETRIFMTSIDPMQKPLLNYLSMVSQAQFTLSPSGKAFSSSFSDGDFYNDPAQFSKHLGSTKLVLQKLWENAKPKVLELTEDAPELLDLIVSAIELLTQRDLDMTLVEQAMNKKWNFSLGSVSHSAMILSSQNDGSITPEIMNIPFKVEGKLAKNENGEAFTDHSATAVNSTSSTSESTLDSTPMPPPYDSAKPLTGADNDQASTNPDGVDEQQDFKSKPKSKKDRMDQKFQLMKEKKKELAKAKKAKARESFKTEKEGDTEKGFPTAPEMERELFKAEKNDKKFKSPEAKNGGSHYTDFSDDSSTAPRSRETSPEGHYGSSATPTVASEKAKLQETLKKEKQKRNKEKKKQRRLEETVVRRPGLWFKNGDRSQEEILGFLAEDDRKANPKVEINSSVKPNGVTSKVALVFFDTPEQASSAYERVDKDAAGTVSIYQPEQHRLRKLPFKKYAGNS